MGEHKLHVLEAPKGQDFAIFKQELNRVIKAVIFHCLGPAFQKHCTECLVKRGVCYRFLNAESIRKLNEVPSLFTPEYCTLEEIEKLKVPKVDIEAVPMPEMPELS